MLQGSHIFFRKNQHFFKTFSSPKVKNSRPKKSNNAACFLLQTHKLCCFRANHSENMRWKGCACTPTCHSFVKICSLDWTTRRLLTQRTLSKFQDGIRREIAHRHYHNNWSWVHRAFCNASKAWPCHSTQALLKSAEYLIVELDAPEKEKGKKKESNALCSWPGSAK